MTDRFKFRVWDSSANAYIPRSQFILLSDGTLIQEIGGEEVIWESTQPEFCTGLKDKNGKLIYEGDIVEIMVWDDIEEDMVETKGKVYWSREDAAFLIYVSYDAEYSLNSHETFYGQEIKVIGNIHENADLIKVGGNGIKS